MLSASYFSSATKWSHNSIALFVAVIASVFSIIAYGLDAGGHHTYNLSYIHIYSNPGRFLGTPLELVLASGFNRFFLLSIAPLLEDPSIVLLLSFLTNTILLFVGYRICSLFFRHDHALLIALLIGLAINSPIMGIDANEIIFTRKTVGVFFVLTSIIGFLGQRFIVGGFLALIAIFFHPINALASLAFFFPGLIAFTFLYQPAHRYRLLLGIFIPIAGLIYTAHSANDLTGGSTSTSLHEWYLLSLNLEADDVAMFWSIKRGAQVFLPLLILAFTCSLSAFNNPEKKPNHSSYVLHCIGILQVPLIIGILVLEFVQIQGLHIPILSEFFPSLQFRRGLWVPCLTAVLILFERFINAPRGRETPWLLGVVIASFLDHTFFSIFCGLVALALISKEKNIRIGGLISIICLLALNTPEISPPSVKHFFLHGMVFLLLVSIFYYLDKHRTIQYAIIITIISHSALILANNTLRHTTFLDSYGYIVDPSYSRNELAKAEHDVLSAINKLVIDPNGLILFAPSALGYDAAIISEHRLIFSRWENMLMFNRKTYSRFLDKTTALGISPTSCTPRFGSNTNCFLQAVQSRIDNLTASQVAALKRYLNIAVIVRRTPLQETLPTIITNKYFIYKI
jgi:hypothetical protein